MIKRRQLVVKEGYESLTANYGGFLSVEDIRRVSAEGCFIGSCIEHVVILPWQNSTREVQG